jgi:hypothetical protein
LSSVGKHTLSEIGWTFNSNETHPKDMHSLAEGGAAFFLLLLPAIEEEEIEETEGEAETTRD